MKTNFKKSQLKSNFESFNKLNENEMKSINGGTGATVAFYYDKDGRPVAEIRIK